MAHDAPGPQARVTLDTPDPSGERRDAIEQALAYAGLRPSQRGLIERYLEQHPDDWMSCCGSCCDPCVLTIGLAVDRARSLLGLPDFADLDRGDEQAR